MSEIVEKVMMVLEAEYVEDADSILIIAECEEGKIRHQIPSSLFTFGDKDKSTEMTKLAELLIDKPINIQFDPTKNLLEKKLKKLKDEGKTLA